jgi:nucleotide-binding universal stress UspA family protein
MLNGIKTILFATDLTQDCVPAFNLATLLALQFKAKIVLLHVIEKIPDYVEGRLEGLLGDESWNAMMHAYEDEARQRLIGKRTTSKLIRNALEHYVAQAGIDETSFGRQSREVVIGDGNVAESIIDHSKTHACDLIVIGGRGDRILRKSVGATVKAVLSKSKIPVLVVPSESDR